MKTTLKKMAGFAGFQPIWERLFRTALSGMNIGEGGGVVCSGESFVLDVLFANLNSQPPFIIFDVGANVGDYAEQVISKLSNKVELYCFEPAASSYSRLESRLAGREGVHLSNIAMGEKDDSLILYSNAPESGIASFYKRRLDHFGITMEIPETVKVSTIDIFCQEHGIDFIHFLKLDVEGHELEVLKGAELLLAKDGVGAIQFEFGGCNIDSRTFFQDFYYLLNGRFKLFRVLKKGLFPIENYKETYEIFITTNFLALSRE